MSKKKNKKHLTLECRIKIAAGIEKGDSLRYIANGVPTSVTTVYREIKRNRKLSNSRNLKCTHIAECLKQQNGLSLNCKSCKKFKEVECKKLNRFPFVCNNCDNRIYCTHSRYFYNAAYADEQASRRLKIPRSGIKVSESSFNAINNIISPLIKQKQSLNHILTTHTEIPVKERTLRNWINKGYTDAKTIDLPRTVRFKVKKEYNYRNTKPASILKDRTYIDFKNYVREHPNLLISEFDTVCGLKKEKKRVLTIHFPSIKFQIGLLVQSGESEEINRVFGELRKKIGEETFKKVFPVMLSDNGVEFNNFHIFENNDKNEKVARLFFTDPYRSGQKGSCERNHELFRYIQPKGKSMEYLTQEILDLYFSNINCYYRDSMPGVRPYDLAKQLFGEDFLKAINIYEIKPDDVTFDKEALLNKIKTK